MSSEADFLKPEQDQALRQSEILALRTLSGHVETLGQQIENFRVDMREVRDKVITFEAAKMEAQISAIRHEMAAQASKITMLEMQKASTSTLEELNGRVRALENDRREATGASKFATRVREWLPTAVIAFGLIVLYFTQHPL